MSLTQLTVAAVAVAVAAASVAVVEREGVDISNPDPPATVRPPSAVTLACPNSAPDRAMKTRVFGVSPDTGKARGSLRFETLAPAPVPLETTRAVKVPLDKPLERKDGPSVLVQARGGLAPGTTAYQYSALQGQRRSGVAISACTEARREWWFSGVDANVGATSRLVLTNPTPGITVVDVAIFGRHGAVSAAGAVDIPLAPYTRKSIDLARLAPGAASATVRVRASRGRLTAAVATTKVNGVTPAGADWIPAAEPPRRDVLVVGGPPQAQRQQLMLTNPGSRQALVQGEALTSSGPFLPSALADLTIPPRSVLVTDITDVVDNASTALHLTSSVEVTAGVVSTVSSPGPEFAVSTTSETLTSRPAVLPFLRDLRTTVCFAMADRAGAAATVVYVDKQGAKMQRRQIQVRGGASTCRRLVPGPGSAYALVSSDSPGVVQAAAHFSGPAGLSTVAIAPGPWEVVRPAVEPAP